MAKQKMNKNKFAIKFIGILVKIIFNVKISLKLRVKPLLYSVFFTDHLIHKTVNKVNCKESPK